MFFFFMKNQRQKDLAEVKRFLGTHLEQLYGAQESIPPDVFNVTAFFITEAIQLYDSIDILDRKNHFRGCLPIARSLLEIAINFQYVYKQNTELRAKSFRLDSMYRMKERGIKLTDEARNNLEYRRLMNRLEAELGGYKPEKKSLFKKAQELNMGSTYESAYRRLSEYAHSGYKPPEDFNQDRVYNNFLKRVVHSDTVILILMGLKAMCEKYDLEGGFMVIDDPGYIGTLFFTTNAVKEEERTKTYENNKKK